jgi:hypothetical protein
VPARVGELVELLASLTPEERSAFMALAAKPEPPPAGD